MKHLILTLFLLGVTTATAQTACSTSNPCLPIQIVNAQATATTPLTATLYGCMGATTGCNTTTLNAFIASPSSPSQWTAVTFTMAKSPQPYNYPVQYSALMNFAAATSFAGGPPSPVSAISTFQVPQETPLTPTLGVGPNLTTTGTTGPQ